jgi:hypothetical protein
MTRDEAIAEEARLGEILSFLGKADEVANELKGEYAGNVEHHLRKSGDRLVEEMPGFAIFPVQVGDEFISTADVNLKEDERFVVLEADEKHVVLSFPNGNTSVRYATATFDAAKERGWLSREDLADVQLLWSF